MHPLEKQIAEIEVNCHDCPARYKCKYCQFNIQKRDLRRQLAKMRKA